MEKEQKNKTRYVKMPIAEYRRLKRARETILKVKSLIWDAYQRLKNVDTSKY